MTKRPYRQTQRALQQEDTRQRIVEATVALHEEVGPRKTTIAAIAERAGVQRLTVYRHFPDADAVFAACTSHWLALHPPPDPAGWAGHARPKARTLLALKSLYAYYRGTARMWARSYRDVEDVPALQQPMAEVEQYLRGIAADLAAAWARGKTAAPALVAGTALATHFGTWQALDRQGLSDDAMADMMVACCAALAREGRTQ
jgi:AcrR family transcriptional regulator